MALGAWLAWATWMPVSPPTQKSVLLRPGYSTRRIATELKSSGVIRSADAFVLWHYLHHKCSLKAGEYQFDKAANEIAIHYRLVRRDIYVHTVVIPEGYTIFDIAQAVQDGGLGSSEDFLRAAQANVALISDLAPEAKTLEGYLFPSTYEFTRTQSMPEMVAAMVKQFRQVAREIGLTTDVQRTVTLASIVEKETAVSDERPLLANVDYKRLFKKNTPQTDPSGVFAPPLQSADGRALHPPHMRFS